MKNIGKNCLARVLRILASSKSGAWGRAAMYLQQQYRHPGRVRVREWHSHVVVVGVDHDHDHQQQPPLTRFPTAALRFKQAVWSMKRRELIGQRQKLPVASRLCSSSFWVVCNARALCVNALVWGPAIFPTFTLPSGGSCMWCVHESQSPPSLSSSPVAVTIFVRFFARVGSSKAPLTTLVALWIGEVPPQNTLGVKISGGSIDRGQSTCQADVGPPVKSGRVIWPKCLVLVPPPPPPQFGPNASSPPPSQTPYIPISLEKF